MRQYACAYLENAEGKQTNKHAKTLNIGLKDNIYLAVAKRGAS